MDEEHPKHKLSGATFVVYRDSNGNKEFDKTDKVCGEMKEASKGIYEMDNLNFGGYFLYEKLHQRVMFVIQNTITLKSKQTRKLLLLKIKPV